MVVICPKCKVRLKVADEKIAPEGTRFKCPKCSTVLLVKRPVKRVRPLEANKVLVAHEEPSVAERLRTTLAAHGYHVVTARDGIEAMVNATRELPFLSILSVSIPKIYGFEVCRRLKSRPETGEMKVILIPSVYDERRYRREPSSLYSADDYLEEQQIEEQLIKKIEVLKGTTTEPAQPAAAGRPAEEPADVRPVAEQKPVAIEERQKPAAAAQPPEMKDMVEKAKRLARTIISDIHLYSKAKMDNAIKDNTFHKVFESELREGLKLYENRIPVQVRAMGDFFNEAINNFIEKRKQELS